MNALFFWFFSIGMIVCALAVVLNRNAVASALCFTFTIVFMAGLFVLLSAFFLAAVQILVTAGAVMVLFLFIIMLLDLTKMEHMPRPKLWMGCTLILGLAFLVLVARTLHDTPFARTGIASLPKPGATIVIRPYVTADGHTRPHVVSQSDWDDQDDTHQIGRMLFATHVAPNEPSYVAPFEITSLLILVATIGVIVLCKRDEPRRPSPRDKITREAPPVNGSEKESALRM
jgi:NADH-quinone oxidoreductase subunit J